MRLAELAARVEELEATVDLLRRQMKCIRCQTEPPPPPRWPGDRWTQDWRPPHTCGLPE